MKRQVAYWHSGCLLNLHPLGQACKRDQVPEELEKYGDLSSFVFKSEENSALWYDIEAEIDGDTIYAHTLAGTDVTELIAEFEFKGIRVTVADAEQQSGYSEQDFSQLVEYTVEAEGGITRNYTVKF